jgi:PHP family Zn ribbon phosphoesterase
VEERVDELADRPMGFRPDNAIDYMHLLPLHEIIGRVLGIENIYAVSVWKIFDSLITAFGTEYSVLLDVTPHELARVVDGALVDAIMRVRSGNIEVIPGYDGVYGTLILSRTKSTQEPTTMRRSNSRKQLGLEDFMEN